MGFVASPGKPFHPPLTDVPIAAYIFGAVFDVLSLALHSSHERLAQELSHGATWISVVIAALVMVGATYGGTLVFDYGFNVETAGDSPLLHRSERDVLPGRKPLATAAKPGVDA